MESEASIDYVFKVVIVGDAGVGKSSILLQFTDGIFDNSIQSTIGVDFKFKIITMDDANGNKVRVKVIIWDTAGQERFRTLTSSYYRGAQGIILAYDVTRPETFSNLSTWLSEVEQFSNEGGRDVVKVLVGNKVDKERAVSRETADAWARSKAMLFLEVSAKTKEGIAQTFNEIVNKVLDSPSLLASAHSGKPEKGKGERGRGRVDLNHNAGEGGGGGGGGCC